jgi:adenylate kinase
MPQRVVKSLARLFVAAGILCCVAPAGSRRVVLLIGPPGAGKTTQARNLSRKYGIPSISMADLLKKDAGWNKAGSKKLAKAAVESGELANDQVAGVLMRKRVMQNDAQSGFILDGYPATQGEAENLDALLKEHGLPAPVVIYLDVPDNLARDRMRTRHRADDSPENIDRRLSEYHRDAQVLMSHYPPAQLHKIDGSGDARHVWRAIEDALAARSEMRDNQGLP